MYSTECVHASHIQHMALTLFGHILSYATDISQVGVPVWYGVFVGVSCLFMLYKWVLLLHVSGSVGISSTSYYWVLVWSNFPI
jgi:hypothetical protein